MLHPALHFLFNFLFKFACFAGSALVRGQVVGIVVVGMFAKAQQAAEGRRKLAAEQAQRQAKQEERAKKDAERAARKASEDARAEAEAAARVPKP